MKEYTLGAFFSESLKKVVLISKQRPAWQVGLYNLPGGKIEPDEDAFACIAREFEEECGVKTHFSEWSITGEITDHETYIVYILACKNTRDQSIKTLTDEEVAWFEVNNLPENTVRELPTIIKDCKLFFS